MSQHQTERPSTCGNKALPLPIRLRPFDFATSMVSLAMDKIGPSGALSLARYWTRTTTYIGNARNKPIFTSLPERQVGNNRAMRKRARGTRKRGVRKKYAVIYFTY